MTSDDRDFQSVTVWLQELKQGSEDAAAELWQRYFRRLVTLARKRLGNAPRRVSDEEDVAACVFRSLCNGIDSGRFDQLDDRDDLWRLLVVMTRHKATKQVRFQAAQKRGGTNVRGHSIVGKLHADENAGGFDIFFGNDPTPELLVQVQEEQERLFGLLSEDQHRRIAQLRLQGYSVEEMAQELGISNRSIKRKLALIREAWLFEFEANDDAKE